MDSSFLTDLKNTGYIHKPLPIREELSLEERLLKKEVLGRRVLWEDGKLDAWKHSGLGSIELGRDEALKRTVFRMTGPVKADRWPEGASPDGDYSNYGSLIAHLKVNDEDWNSYNRISFRVKPDCPGMRAVHLNMCLKNDGEIKVPDVFFREGCHVINLKNRVWNSCIWEFPDLPRDKVTEIMFYVFVCGKDISTGDYLQYDFDSIELQRVEKPEKALGWDCAPGMISFSTTGYWIDGLKTAIGNINADSFNIVEQATGRIAFSAPVKTVVNSKGSFSILDFTEMNVPGRYRIAAGDVITESFEIGSRIMDEAVWKVINFLYCERCGFPVSGRHGACHQDIIAEHNGVKLAFSGGWHDAGDVSQQMAQTAEVTHALFEMAGRLKSDTALYSRLMEEAEWGLDFVLRMRFGDGFRVTSAGATRWTNGLIGDMDDVAARVHNHAFENFLCSGIEAFASIALKEWDPELSWRCGVAAAQDYGFALARFEDAGVEQANMYEHTYNSSLSQYYATASWAASQIFEAIGEPYYAGEARKFAGLMLECQETGDAKLPLSGFFYRDSTKKTIVHFNHQSRDQIYVQALEALCRTQKDHCDLPEWEKGMRLYGQYLKDIMKYTEPYGMIPAGLHCMDEADDTETFKLLHLHTTFENEHENYIQQLKNGVQVGDKHYLRSFPVWFSFRGNTAVHLAMGKAAALAGRYFDDRELIQIAREQLYWIAGKNPFGQSLMYGEGSNYAQQYAVLPGEMVGELPVGIQTRGNEDVPYWPQGNNATYKEAWTTPAGRWLWVAADIL
jgi:hypothetical protein